MQTAPSISRGGGDGGFARVPSSSNDDARFGLWAQRVVQALAGSGGWHVTVVQQDARFVRLTVVGGDLVLKIENILANKLTAVVERDEPRDLADIWGFCCRMGLSCEAALEGAQSKAAGLFPADVARVLLSVSKDDWQPLH